MTYTDHLLEKVLLDLKYTKNEIVKTTHREKIEEAINIIQEIKHERAGT